MEFIEFIIFIIGCVLSHIAGIFLCAFIAGIINGILLLREAKNNYNQNVNEAKNAEQTLEIIDENKDNSNTSEKQEILNTKVKQLIEESIDFEKSIKDTREKLNDIYNSLC